MFAIENMNTFLLFKWECRYFGRGCPTVHVKVEFETGTNENLCKHEILLRQLRWGDFLWRNVRSRSCLDCSIVLGIRPFDWLMSIIGVTHIKDLFIVFSFWRISESCLLRHLRSCWIFLHVRRKNNAWTKYLTTMPKIGWQRNNE